MDSWKKRASLAAFLLFFVSMACLIVLIPGTSTVESRPFATLPDGRVVRVEALTYGKNQEWTTGPKWLERLQSKLPPSLRKFLGNQVKTFRNSSSRTNGTVWLSVSMLAGSSNPRWTDLAVLSESGERFAWHGWSQAGSHNGRKIYRPSFDVVPSRDKTFVVVGKLDSQEFELKVTNPFHDHVFPSFSSEAIPAVRKAGGFEFTLQAGQLWVSPNYQSFSPRIVVTENGQARDDWFSPSYQLFDALGNRNSMLSTNESVWGIDVTLARTPKARWATNEFFEFESEFPESGEHTLAGISHHFGGVEIHEIQLMGSGRFTFTNGVLESAMPHSPGSANSWSSSTSASGDAEMGIGRGSPWLLLSTTGLSSNDRLDVRAYDQQGKEIKVTRGGISNMGPVNGRIYQYPPDAKGLLKFRISYETPFRFQYFISTKDLKYMSPPGSR